jgi:hypothetical protein
MVGWCLIMSAISSKASPCLGPYTCFNINDELLSLLDPVSGIWLVLDSLCKNLGVDTWGQVRKLREDKTYQGFLLNRHILVQSEALRGGERLQEMWCLHLDMVPMWLAGLTASSKEEVQSKLVRYKRECAHVLREYWLGGGVVVNPRTYA